MGYDLERMHVTSDEEIEVFVDSDSGEYSIIEQVVTGVTEYKQMEFPVEKGV